MDGKTGTERCLVKVLQIRETFWLRIVEMEASHSQAVQAGDTEEHGGEAPPGGGAWIQLPESLVGKLRTATRTSGLSLESLVYDALDFYLEEKIYKWLAESIASSEGGQRHA